MANESIVIDIAPDGSVTIEGKNFTGAECERATKEIELALGAVEKRVKKPEYHRTHTVGTRKASA